MKLPEHIDVVLTIGDSTETIRYTREPGRRISVGVLLDPPRKYDPAPKQIIPSTITRQPKRRGLLGWLDEWMN